MLVLPILAVVGNGVALNLLGAQSADISRQSQDLIDQTRSAMP